MRNAKAWTLLLPIALLTAILILLAGCGGSPVLNAPDTIGEKTIRLSDGREVICVIYAQRNVTCDWDHPLSNIDVPLEDTK